MPPHSFREWMVGQNVVKRSSRKPRPVFTVELETDDESESDVLKLTYPRTGRNRRSRGKKVRFSEDTHKSAFKKASVHSPSGSDVDFSTKDTETSKDEETTDEDITQDCPCAGCVAARRSLKKAKAKSKKQETESSEDDSEDDAVSVHAKHMAKKAKQVEALKVKGDAGKQKCKPKAKKGKKSESEAETTDAAATETEPETGGDTEAATDGKTGGNTNAETEADTTEVETTEPEKEAPNKKGKKGKDNQLGEHAKQAESKKPDNQSKKGKQGKQGNKGKQDSPDKPDTQDAQDEQNKQQDGSQKQESKNEKDKPEEGTTGGSTSLAFQMAMDLLKQEKKKMKKAAKAKLPAPRPAGIRQGNFLLPPETRVLHVEHTLEMPQDPRPNAFFDNVNGVMRVYHGPMYGNPSGVLYPRVYDNSRFPIGTPHPAQNPWYNAAPEQPAPPHTPRPRHPPAPSGPPQGNPWLQGYGSVTVGKPPEQSPVPDFAAGSNQKKWEKPMRQHDVASLSPAKSAKSANSPTKSKPKSTDKGGQSNVIPTIEVTGPKKGQSNGRSRSKPWDIQGAHGSRKSSGSQDGSKNGGRGGNKKTSPNREDKSGMHLSLDEMMAKDSAETKARQDRWSSKSASKEPSPVPQDTNSPNGNGDWGGSNNAYNNKATGNGWGGSNNGYNKATVDDWGGNNDAHNNKATGNDWGVNNNGYNNATVDDWGGNNNANNAGDWGGGDADNADWSKAPSGRAFWDGGNSNGSKQDGSNGASGWRGGNTSTNNVFNDNNGSYGGHVSNRGNGDKKPNKASQSDSPSSQHSIPGAWISSPKSEASVQLKAPHSSPDNVGGWGGSDHGSARNDGSGDKKAPRNGRPPVWQDYGAAQSSGGVFDQDTKENGDSNSNGIDWGVGAGAEIEW
ncbi:hypothetical protein F4677DRAFT_105014 [Hypoxylon crocopeplum]|nr:hypothetical protein F4677DRAFT_105014 [Hypoxylon crocopeplum]